MVTYNLARSRIYNVNDNYFDIIDNQEKSYIFGLFYADACNYENTGKVKIDLQEDDKNLLEIIKDKLEYTGTLKCYYEKYKTFGDRVYECKPSIRLLINSKHMSEQLALKGCVHNKSKVAKFPDKSILPDNLLRHFIRGYMDGNGSISYWIDNENTKHKKFQIGFCGTTDIIETISKIIGEKFNCCPAISDRHPDRDNNNLQVCIAGNRKCKDILDWLYKDANIYMQRKYDKYLELIDEVKRVENDTTLYGNAYPRRAVINLETKEIYNTVNGAGKALGVSGSTIFTWCHKHKNVMYLDEYEELFGKINNI